MWMKIFCFVFSAMKTDAFENALVWIGPYIAFGVEFVWDNKRLNGSWNVYLASPEDFPGVYDIITNLAKEKEPGIEIIERTP